MNTDPTAKYVIGGFWLAILLAVIGFSTGILYVKEDPEPQTSSISTSLEDRCDFVVKSSNGESLHISEPSAGVYQYELYATPDGYVEVWKCN